MTFTKWLFVVLLTIPFCATASKKIEVDELAKASALKELKTRMKDPDSAVIRSSFIVRRPDSKFHHIEEVNVCGVVDGKNSYGGYTGGTLFVAIGYLVVQEKQFFTITVALESLQEKRRAESVGTPSPFERVYWNVYCVDGTKPPVGIAPR